ncbi:hypothetical protein FA95DRAFT_1572440 [Auriscalpium vulgare]|uniref:Uncharacterized protein n=1 Tax=Auriscalpium vulgare TaxID=40419 RepID=A0ACB8RUL7_9AGAM|nr:hypothetical protein FA95DRAFT_1572440 [Auriscalpium vulgare]
MHPELDSSFIAATRTAMMYQKAVEEAHRYLSIGHCSTKIRLFRASSDNTHYFTKYNNKEYAVGWEYCVHGGPYIDYEGLENDGDKEPLKRNESGYSVVVAFKIFQDGAPDPPETEADTATITGIRRITDALEAPVALLLRRRYCLEPHWLSGFDALLYSALMRRTDINVHLIPIVINFSASLHLNGYSTPVRRSFSALVYPFTSEHIDYIGGARKTDPAKSTMPWLAGLEKNVQFLAMDFEGSTVQWSHKKWDDSSVRGDETQEWTEDSVYLSYALIIVPKTSREVSE